MDSEAAFIILYLFPLNKVSEIIPSKVTITLGSWLYSPAAH